MLILVRHGRTAANATGLLQGRHDHPLDELGRRQARAVSAVVGTTIGPDARVISSPLRRAVETAEAIAAALHAPVDVDGSWIELDYGVFDGRPHGDVAADVWAQWRADPQFAPPEGESLADLDARVVSALDALALEAGERDVVVVSHVSPIKAAIAWAIGSDAGSVSWRCHLDVASICRIRMSPHGPVLVSFNETSHLIDVATDVTDDDG